MAFELPEHAQKPFAVLTEIINHCAPALGLAAEDSSPELRAGKAGEDCAASRGNVPSKGHRSLLFPSCRRAVCAPL